LRLLSFGCVNLETKEVYIKSFDLNDPQSRKDLLDLFDLGYVVRNGEHGMWDVMIGGWMYYLIPTIQTS